MEKNSGFNDQPDKDRKRSAEDDTDTDSSSSKKNRRSADKERQAKLEDSEKRRAKAEPLGQMIIGEEIVLFEKPKQEDKLRNDEAVAETVDDDDAEAALSTAVEVEVGQEIIQQRIPEVEAEIAAAQTAEATEVAQADEQFLEAAREAIEANPDAPVEQALEQAYRETAAEITGQPVAETDVPTMPQPETEAPEQTGPPPAEATAEPLSHLEAARQAAAQAHEVEPPRDSSFWLDQPGRSIEGAVSPSGPARPSAEVIPGATAERAVIVTKSSWVALATGYVIGRRGGRKRAEKRLKPVIERLNQTAKSLRAAVTGHEAQIRDLSREQVVARRTAEQRSREVPTMPLPTDRPEVVPVLIPQPRQETVPTQRVEQAPPQRAPEAAPPIIAEQLATPQLLQVAEQIRVDGISVRSMHEVGRFDENSLRRIVHEYLGGNRDIARVVAQEVEKHDRNRFARFETLSQSALPVISGAAAAPGPIAPPAQTHGSLPRPIDPAAQQTGVNPSTGQPAEASQPIGTAEKVVLGTSVLFIVLAIVIIGVVLARS